VVADSEHLSEHLPGLIERLPRGSAVTIAPSFFSGQGLLFDLPSGILVGVHAATTDSSTRARTDLLAKRLKAFADPTRLAIVQTLATGPMTVGEIARSFDLAQPTVSNHIENSPRSGSRDGNPPRHPPRARGADRCRKRVARRAESPPQPVAQAGRSSRVTSGCPQGEMAVLAA